MEINKINFQPLLGLSSRHLQMIFPLYASLEKTFISERELVRLEEENFLSCEVSTPPYWKGEDPTVVLVHGMGGSHSSNYMIRMAKKNYAKGKKVIRVNLRGCGSGAGLSKLPYNAGTSHDILKVLEVFKQKAPLSEIVVIGFSLGGNVVLKLAGELKANAKTLVKKFIAVCPPMDLEQCVKSLEARHNRVYHFHYLKWIHKQAKPWILTKKFKSLYDFDNNVTAPLWGYKDASEYYETCSSLRFLPTIEQPTHILLAKDDPFVPFDKCKPVCLPPSVKMWVTEKGSHMGFIGKGLNGESIYWMDEILLKWIEETW